MENMLLDALQQHLQGKVAYHRANIEVYMRSSVGIGEHPDIMEAMESELGKLAEADEKLETLKKYFSN
jgi:hypothetical protein